MNNFCLNELSLPAPSKNEATQMMTLVFTGIAKLTEDTVPYLLATHKLNNVQLAEGFSFSDYKTELLKNHADIDFILFVLDIQDKSPLIETINDVDILDIASSELTIFNTPIAGEESDLLKFCCLHQAFSLSLPTIKIWKSNSIQITIKTIDKSNTDSLKNIYNDDIHYFLPQTISAYTRITDDRTKFKKTPWTWSASGERIYQELTTGYYWYFDFFHKDNKQHYEVFNKQKIHLGEADMDGVLDFGKKDASKNNKLPIN